MDQVHVGMKKTCFGPYSTFFFWERVFPIQHCNQQSKSQTSASQYISKSNKMCQTLLAVHYYHDNIVAYYNTYSKNTKMVQDNHVDHDNDEIRV